MSHYNSDLRGKTYIVTGATSGLGLETARLLFFEGHAHVLLAVRDLRSASDLILSWRAAYVAAQPPPPPDGSEARSLGSVSCAHLDLASLASVRSFAEDFLASGVSLSGLVNNGGVFQLPGATADGFQNVFQTNYLSHALLTELLLPASTSDFRVVNVSSKLHNLVGKSSLSDRMPPPPGAGAGYGDYAFSKACQVAHAFELERVFKLEAVARGGGGVQSGRRMAFAVEPGLVKTGIMRQSSAVVRFLNYFLLAPILKTTQQGISSTIFCLVSTDLKEGGFFDNCERSVAAEACEDETEIQKVNAAFRRITGLD